MLEAVLRIVLPCMLTAAVFTAAPAYADVEKRSPANFHLRATLGDSAASGDAYTVPLSVEAVAALKKGGELRLFDAQDAEIPSLLVTADGGTRVVEHAAVLFNQAWQEDGSQSVSIELTDRMPEQVDEFRVEIGDGDYHLTVRVEGSDDAADWKILADGLNLIRHTVESEKIHYDHDVLRIPPARFRYYRFTSRSRLSSSMPDEPLEIGGIQVREVVRRGSSLPVPVSVERFTDPHDKDERHQYWRIDLPDEDLGVDLIELTIPERDYARPASLWEWSTERNRRTRRLARTVLFQFGEDVHAKFSGFSTDAKQLVLMVDQGDDAPIAVSSARANRPLQQLRFLSPAGASFPLALYFEPDKARKPRYDLERRLRENDISSFIELAHAKLETNPDYMEPAEPRSEQIPYLLWALVVPLVLALGWYVASTIRRGLPSDED